MRLEIRPSSNFNPRVRMLEGQVGRRLSKTIKELRTDAKRKLRERYTLKSAGVLNQRLKTISGGLSVELRGAAGKILLSKFKHKPTKRQKIQNPAGMYSEVVRGQGGFLRQAWTKYAGGIFRRVTKERFPIRAERGPSVAEMMSALPVSNFIERKLQERVDKNFQDILGAVIL